MSAKVAKTTVPSVNDVLVPETLLKKRRDDAKSREEKQAKALEARKVSITTKYNDDMRRSGRDEKKARSSD